MEQATTIFSEILKIVPLNKFKEIVTQYQGDRYTKKFTTRDQLATLIFSQITGSDSLREIQGALESCEAKLYHNGLPHVKRSTLSESMERRDYRMFEALFYKTHEKLVFRSRKHQFRFHHRLQSIDSSTINLCPEMFSWAKYKSTKGAVKIHTLLDHDSLLPEFIKITDGKTHDLKAVTMPDSIDQRLKPDSIVVFDRAYIEYKWLQSLTDRGIYFVTRCKKNMTYRFTGQHLTSSRECIRRDDKIRFSGKKAAQDCPDELRLVEYYDESKDKHYEFYTNIFHLSAKTIADIYKSRWEIELFFKCFKQNLKIKSFIGTSKNAVLSQIWVAMCVLLIVKYIQFQTKFEGSFNVLFRKIRTTLFDKVCILDILYYEKRKKRRAMNSPGQLALIFPGQ